MFAVPGALQPVLTLAIETANPGSRTGGVALGQVSPGDAAGVTVLGVETLRVVDRDRDDLIPAIERLLAASGRVIGEIRQVAVSCGPGGFTSTRVACASGAMLAEGLGIPVLAVPSALVAAVSVPGRGRVAVLMASKGAAAWCAVIDTATPALSWPEQARNGAMMQASQITAAAPILALADHHLHADIRSALTAAGVAIQPLSFTPEACLRAAALCQPADPSACVPIYPREPEAVTLWRARHGDSRKQPPLADSPGR